MAAKAVIKIAKIKASAEGNNITVPIAHEIVEDSNLKLRIQKLEEELEYYRKMSSNDALIGMYDLLKHENADLRKELERLKAPKPMIRTPSSRINAQRPKEWLLAK